MEQRTAANCARAWSCTMQTECLCCSNAAPLYRHRCINTLAANSRNPAIHQTCIADTLASHVRLNAVHDDSRLPGADSCHHLRIVSSHACALLPKAFMNLMCGRLMSGICSIEFAQLEIRCINKRLTPSRAWAQSEGFASRLASWLSSMKFAPVILLSVSNLLHKLLASA